MAMTLAVANAWTTAKSASPLHHQFKPSNNSSGFEACSRMRLALCIPKSPILSKHCYYSKLICCCSRSNTSTSTSTSTSCSSDNSASPSDWDWDRWKKHITQVELLERHIFHLKAQLEEALENEDFEEARNLKTAISESMLMDNVDELMSKLESALHEERYHDASKLGRISRLVGWWVGYSKGCVDEPFSKMFPDCGRIVRITPGVGRFIGRVYSWREFETGSQGTPLFEIVVVKNTDTTYTMQVVFLQRPPAAEVENATVMDGQIAEDVQNDNVDGATEDIRSVIDEITSVTEFLKGKLPELKLENSKITNINSIEDIAVDMKQLIEEIDDNALSSEDSKDEKTDLDDSQPDDTIKEAKDLSVKPFIGGALHDKEDMPPKDEYVRVPVVIEEMEQDSFVLHVSPYVPTVGNYNEIPRFASDEFCLYEFTNFIRISTSREDLDPLNGLYICMQPAINVGRKEVVQLRHKYGSWGNNNGFFEYVEAVKLTGEARVPAGQVTFRAKIPKGFRLSDPKRFSVIGRLSGEGKNDLACYEWEPCELHFLGKWRMYEGADIRFRYPLGCNYLDWMYKRLELPE